MNSSTTAAVVQRGPSIPPARHQSIVMDRRPDAEMQSGLFAVSKRPASLDDIKSFQALHNPRLHSMTEWIVQYENARQRQDLYLNELRDLRELFSTKGRPPYHAEPGFTPRRFWTPAWQSELGSPPQTRAKRGFFSTPSEACVLFAKDLSPRRRLRRPEFWSRGPTLTSFHTVNSQRHTNTASNSSASNRYINIVRNYNSGRFSAAAGSSSAKGSWQSIQVQGARHSKLPPIEGHHKLARHKTDYEPFERISRRNKLNLTSFLREERARVSPQHSIDLSEVRVQATPIPCSR